MKFLKAPPKKMRDKVKIERIEQRDGDCTAYLSYSVDAPNRLTIWHTEVPPLMQHGGVGGSLVRQALDLANDMHMHLRIVCPFARDYLVRHPELKDEYKGLLSTTTGEGLPFF